MLTCRIHLKRQKLNLQQPPQKENNPHAETMKSHQCNFACGCYARLCRDYLWHWALQLAASCITHLHNKQHFTAAGLEPGQSSLPLALAAVFCENALSHFKTKGRKWSKGDCWGEKEKNTPLHISLAQVKEIYVIFFKIWCLSLFVLPKRNNQCIFSMGIHFFLAKVSVIFISGFMGFMEAIFRNNF